MTSKTNFYNLASRVEDASTRTVQSLNRLEKAWLRRRYCGFCEASMLGSSCHALTGEYELPVIEGIRDKPEIVNMGPGCDMDERRAHALKHYKPRAASLRALSAMEQTK